jgi:hypothetical protein
MLHTLIWGGVSAILYVLYCGVADRLTAYTGAAAGLVGLEGLVLAVFRGRCPLTLLARKYSRSTAANFDIFLPEWLARYNQAVFTLLYLAGLLAVGYRLLQ